MAKVSNLELVLWLASLAIESALIAAMIRSGDSRRWRGLFALVCIMAGKGSLRLTAIFILKNPYVDFFAYWVGEFAASAARIWVTVEIGGALCGVSEWSRAIIRRFIPFTAALSIVVSVWFAMRDQRYDDWMDWMYFIAQRVHMAVSLAGLATFLLVAFIAERFSEWSHGVRSIAIGFSFDLTATSYLGWLTVHTQHAHFVAGVRSLFYLATLSIWLYATRPRIASSDHRHHLPALFGRIESCIRLLEVK